MDTANTAVAGQLPLTRQWMMAAISTCVVFLIGLAFGPVVTAQDDPTAKPFGRWRSVETSRGGIGSLLTFQQDGVVEFSLGAVVEMTYRVEGNQLILPPGTINGPEQRQTMTWLSPDRLQLAIGEGQPALELARKVPQSDSANPIVGEWSGVRDIGGPVEATYFFYSGARALLLIPFQWQRGNYSPSDRQIHIALSGAPPVDAIFKLQGGVLTVTANARTTTYRRY